MWPPKRSYKIRTSLFVSPCQENITTFCAPGDGPNMVVHGVCACYKMQAFGFISYKDTSSHLQLTKTNKVNMIKKIKQTYIDQLCINTEEHRSTGK